MFSMLVIVLERLFAFGWGGCEIETLLEAILGMLEIDWQTDLDDLVDLSMDCIGFGSIKLVKFMIFSVLIGQH